MNRQNGDQLPRLRIELRQMTPSREYIQRTGEDGLWRPPRPLGSNIPVYDPVWYEYRTGRTNRVQQRDQAFEHYKTYSFYCHNDTLYIYPSDATRHKVGDGLGNPRVVTLAVPSTRLADEEENGSGSSDFGDDDDNDRNPNVADWRPLGFEWTTRDGALVSHASFPGQHETLYAQWADHGLLRELLPNRNLASPSSPVVLRGQGGLTGELPILLALIAYSVPVTRVDWALRHCFQQSYVPHSLDPIQGRTCSVRCV